MTESVAWQSVKKNLKRPFMHIQRIEDNITPGIPDTNFCYNGIEIWLEGKFLKKLPKRDTSIVKIGLRPEQVIWIENRIIAGGRCYVWVRINLVGWFLVMDNFRRYSVGMSKSEFLSITPCFKNSKELVEALL